MEQKFCNKCTLKTFTAGAASKPLKMMIKMFNQNDTQSAAVFECEVDIFRGVIKMFLTGYQTDFGGYLTHFCTHTAEKLKIYPQNLVNRTDRYSLPTTHSCLKIYFLGTTVNDH